MMSKDNNIDFSVSTTFQERLSKAFSGDERSNVEIAKEIGISKDVFIRALKAGLIPSTRTLIKIADHLEASIDTLKEKLWMMSLFLKDWKNSGFSPTKSMELSLLPLEFPEASSICGSKRITFPVWKFATN